MPGLRVWFLATSLVMATSIGCADRVSERAYSSSEHQVETAPPPRSVERPMTSQSFGWVTVVNMAESSFTVKKQADGKVVQCIVGKGLLSNSLRYRFPPQSYRYADLRVGDVIGIDFNSYLFANVVEIAVIRRRPGGRVPVAPGDREDDNWAWHVRMNCEQDFEEKGIPLPKRFAQDKTFGRINGVLIPREAYPREGGVPKPPITLPQAPPPQVKNAEQNKHSDPKP